MANFYMTCPNYLILKSKHWWGSKPQCTYEGGWLAFQGQPSGYCPHCGTKLIPVSHCPDCGGSYNSHDSWLSRYCIWCGKEEPYRGKFLLTLIKNLKKKYGKKEYGSQLRKLLRNFAEKEPQRPGVTLADKLDKSIGALSVQQSKSKDTVLEDLLASTRTFRPIWTTKEDVSLGKRGSLEGGELGTNASLARSLRTYGFDAQVEILLPNRMKGDILVDDEFLIEAKIDLSGKDTFSSLLEKLNVYKNLNYKIIVVIYGSAREDLVKRLESESACPFKLIILGVTRPIGRQL